MTAADEAPPRIQTLDIVRGIAVMGILAMNIIAFSMPAAAYMNPMAYGIETAADMGSWLFSFVFIDGKMRGLFSFLFGASLLIVVDRADARGDGAAEVHFRRMFWLAVFGLIHYYFIWYGDILFGYAMGGFAAYLFRHKPPLELWKWGIGLLAVQFLLMAVLAGTFYAAVLEAASPGASPETLRSWKEMSEGLAVPSAKQLAEELATYGGGYPGILRDRAIEHGADPFFYLFFFYAETLAYMLFGMALLKNGFLKGERDDRSYAKTAAICLALSVPAYALLAWALVAADFSVPMIVGVSMAATTAFRPLMIVAYAALIILLTRRGGGLVERIAAAGRAAFTNYLGTSILMTSLFYGYGGGLFGKLGRIELWLVVFAMWALMLAWSKPWLDRYLYGPFEWLWRTLSRGSIQPMRRPVTTG